MPSTARIEDEYQDKIEDIKDTYELEPSLKQVVEQAIDNLHEKRCGD